MVKIKKRNLSFRVMWKDLYFIITITNCASPTKKNNTITKAFKSNKSDLAQCTINHAR